MGVYDINGVAVAGNVETDKTLTQSDVPADALVVGERFDILETVTEPTTDDIPCLYFTGGELPQSKDEGKVLFEVLYVSKTLRFSEYVTLKVQGDGSTKYPKKNYNIQFFKDAEKTKKSKHDFKGWGKQSKFTIKANWSDITHARNIVAARLWTDILHTRADFDTLPEELRTAPNLAVIDGFTVRVFHNGVYQGRYTFNLPKDPWMFNMDDEQENNVVLYGEGKAGGQWSDSPRFRALAVVDGNDWSDEIHEDNVPQSVVDDLNGFITFVMNSTNASFRANLSTYVDVASLTDVHILALCDCGIDSIGKNEIFMKYNGSRYICSVYDLESTWGLRWDGAIGYYPSNYSWSTYRDRSLLHQRFASLFADVIRTRYVQLRATALSESNIISRFEEFMRNLSPALIAEDYAATTAGGAFVDMPSVDTNTIQYVRQYVIERLAYADSVILV